MDQHELNVRKPLGHFVCVGDNGPCEHAHICQLYQDLGNEAGVVCKEMEKLGGLCRLVADRVEQVGVSATLAIMAFEMQRQVDNLGRQVAALRGGLFADSLSQALGVKVQHLTPDDCDQCPAKDVCANYIPGQKCGDRSKH